MDGKVVSLLQNVAVCCNELVRDTVCHLHTHKHTSASHGIKTDELQMNIGCVRTCVVEQSVFGARRRRRVAVRTALCCSTSCSVHCSLCYKDQARPAVATRCCSCTAAVVGELHEIWWVEGWCHS